MTVSALRSVGLAGLGLMGRPMALNLLRGGLEVAVWNRSPAPAEALAAAGAARVETPGALAQASEAVILMLADTPAVEAVLFADTGVIAGLRPGTLVIDMGTTAVSATRRFAAAVEAAGGAYVDAPVSGGVVGATEGTLTIMAGGPEDAVARARPLFDILGRTVTHVGGAGAGQVAKAANQMIVGVTIGAVAEAMALARRAGVDPERLREALMGGFAASRVLDLHGRRMAEKAFAAGAKATTQHKDLVQALDLAAEVGLELPLTTLDRDLYARLIERGDGGLDHAALVRVIDDWA
jgi:3-hydroxyisobutyrate dehydrogenase-like beta-hydroxyacid dehydrogenase